MNPKQMWQCGECGNTYDTQEHANKCCSEKTDSIDMLNAQREEAMETDASGGIEE